MSNARVKDIQAVHKVVTAAGETVDLFAELKEASVLAWKSSPEGLAVLKELADGIAAIESSGAYFSVLSC